MQNKVFLWIALATTGVLLIPLLGNWPWSISDFIVMGALLLGVGNLFVVAARKVRKEHRVAVGFAFALLLLYLWAELAVGIFTNLGS